MIQGSDRPALIAYRGPFDGFHAMPASVSKTLLVRFDYNKYSVHAKAAGRPVEIHAYAARIVIRQDGEVVAEHARCFSREQVVYDPWHYLPVLTRKPGALRNGAPFKDGALKLAGMRHAYDEVVADAVKRQHSAQRVVGDLLKAEIDESKRTSQ